MFNSKRILELETALSGAKTTADQAAKLAIRLQQVTEDQHRRINVLVERMEKTQQELNQLYAKTGCTKYQVEKTGPQ